MIIRATFIGRTSLGYETGKTYTLKISGLSIKKLYGGGECDYQSLESFLRNWNNIVVQ